MLSSDILRAVIFGLAIVTLVVQFILDLVERREQRKENETHRAALTRIEDNVAQLVAAGKITEEEGQVVLRARLDATLGPLKADIKTEVKRADGEGR